MQNTCRTLAVDEVAAVRISFKLIASYISIATIIALLGWHLHSTGRSVQRQLAAVKQVDVVGIVDGGVMNEALLEAHRIVFRQLTSGGDRADANTDRADNEPGAPSELNRQLQLFQRSLERSRHASRQFPAASSSARPEALLSDLQDAFNEHRTLLTETLLREQEEQAEAGRFFDNHVDAHYRSTLLPALAAWRNHAEQEFSLHTRGIEEHLDRHQSRTTWLSLAAALASIAVGLWISRQIVLPLQTLQAAAQRIGSGDFHTAVDIASRDELGVLGAAFNQMGDELQATMVSRDRLEKLLAEKEVLLREIHHRVKNNLQIISSILRLQATETCDPVLQGLLGESQNRVRAMARIHEQLHQSDDLEKINIADYIQELCENLTRSQAVSARDVQLVFDVDSVQLPLDSAIPCGLILNELVSNALKHAFAESTTSRELTVVYHAGKERHAIGVRDNGQGVAGIDWREGSSLGLKLVRALAAQLHGELTVVTDGGTSIMVEYPAAATAGDGYA